MRRGATLALTALLAVAPGAGAGESSPPRGPHPAWNSVDDASWVGSDGRPRRVYRPRFVPAAALLDGLRALGLAGTDVALDAPRDRLLLAGDRAAVAPPLEALEFLDVPPAQVLVEVVVAETQAITRRETGGHVLFDRSAPAGAANTVFRGVRYAFEPESWLRSQLVGGRPFEGTSTTFSSADSDGPFSGTFETVLRSLAHEGCADLLASPVVVCTEGVPARVSSTTDIPRSAFRSENGAVLLGFPTERAGVTLEVTATRVGTDHVTLDVHPWVRQVTRATAEGGPEDAPVLEVREASTSLVLADGETALLGGLASRRRTGDRRGLPWLDRLPGVDGFLAAHGTADEVLDLVVLVRPRILVPGRPPAPNLPPGEAERLLHRPAPSRARLVPSR